MIRQISKYTLEFAFIGVSQIESSTKSLIFADLSTFHLFLTRKPTLEIPKSCFLYLIDFTAVFLDLF